MANNIVFIVDEYLQQPDPSYTNLLSFNLNGNRIKGNSSYISVSTGTISNTVQLSGTVKCSTSSNTIVGQSSIFDLELSPGDRIRATGFTNDTVVRVHSITGAQTMIVTPRPPVSLSTAANAYIRKLEIKAPERFKIGANGHTIALKSLTVAKNLKVIGNTSIAGYLTKSNQPMFYGTHNSSTMYSSGELIKIFSAYDPVGMFSGSPNYRVTAPVAGRYMITANLLLDSSSSGSLSVQIRKNGVAQRRFYCSSGHGYQSAGCSVILSLAAGDYIDLWCLEAALIYGFDTGTITVVFLG